MTIRIDEEYLVSTLARLVQINSTNPSLSPDGAGEAEIAAFVAGALRDLGLEVTAWELAPGRWNVVGQLAGHGRSRSLLWNAHLDTVGVAGMTEPFSGAVRDGRVYGRGSQDMKGSLAAMLAATKGLVESGVQLGGDLLVTAVADEEHSSIGADDLVARGFHADAAIVTEPTDLAVCLAHRGFIWYDVETFGRAAHGSRYREGIDANMHMGRFLAELAKLEVELRTRPSHPLVDVPSLHAATLHGGTELSVYAAHCRLQVERRTVPGETIESATAELQAIIDRLSAADPTFRATATPTFSRPPLAVDESAAIVQVVKQAAETRLGRQPAVVGQPFWTDAAIFAAAGMETMLIGPTGHGLHSAEEWVDVVSVVDLAVILADTAVRYLNR
ncbi:MAG: ArgE/DapE family deacylase [Anaerolineae bacterium]|nr:ArgE/DapE family deacylase [Anaerolineae bacterium]